MFRVCRDCGRHGERLASEFVLKRQNVRSRRGRAGPGRTGAHASAGTKRTQPLTHTASAVPGEVGPQREPAGGAGLGLPGAGLAFAEAPRRGSTWTLEGADSTCAPQWGEGHD